MPKGFLWDDKYRSYTAVEYRIDDAYRSIMQAEISRETEENGTRHYRCPNNQYGFNSYPSITTILASLPSSGLDEWKVRVGAVEAARIGKAATKRGSELHGHLEDILHNKLVDLTPCTAFIRQMVKSAAAYLSNINMVYQVESVLWSHNLQVAGSVDCVADWKGKLSVIDFKTANKAKLKEYINSYFLQTTAYALMFEEMYHVPIEDVVVMIAVEGAETQIFEAKVADYREQLIGVIDHYHATRKEIYPHYSYTGSTWNYAKHGRDGRQAACCTVHKHPVSS